MAISESNDKRFESDNEASLLSSIGGYGKVSQMDLSHLTHVTAAFCG